MSLECHNVIIGSFLSMGYGFVEFKNKKEALSAVKELQVCIDLVEGK